MGGDQRAGRTAAGLPSLQRFARHLQRDLDAVTAGLSQPWNSGVVEGHVNRIKMLKRPMFGREAIISAAEPSEYGL
ncbi:hypothetical protein [Streptomyces sp. NPDC085665]|uniref:hypothetical protein n=1 Tax=Streptomyces sp. NPDC085665 TaxID=3365735 RepID=UPI0037D2CD93